MKVGDYVICRNAAGSRGRLIKDQKYLIIKRDKKFLALEGVASHDARWLDSRFDLAPEPMTDTALNEALAAQEIFDKLESLKD